jgi:hypothetical protein
MPVKFKKDKCKETTKEKSSKSKYKYKNTIKVIKVL